MPWHQVASCYSGGMVMNDYTFEDYKKIVEEHLSDFLPDIDH